MSLLICSSAQDKYESKGSMVVGDPAGNLLPSSSLATGIQNPNAFTNNINPVMVIPANSEIALKDISFCKKSLFRVGVNVSLSLYVGELLTDGVEDTVTKSLYEVTSMPFPIPLQPGDYNERTFANMLTRAFDEWASYPDISGRCWVEPASTQADGTNTQGYIFKFDRSTGDTPPNRADEMITAIRHYRYDEEFTYTPGTMTYTATDDDFHTNEGILTDIPLSLNNGVAKWDVSACTGGWRVGLIRPSIEGPRAHPDGFNLAYSANLNTFQDICIEYDQRTDAGYADAVKTLRIYHAVVEDGIHCMREVEYYNNVAADFEPGLNTYLPAKADMYRAAAATATTIGGNPTDIQITVSGEDTEVRYTAGGTDYILTDSRLCIAANVTAVPDSVAGVPTRNRFIKPIGINTWALYPIMSLKTDTESVVLSTWTGIAADQGTYRYPEPASELIGDNAPAANANGRTTSGHSFYGRASNEDNMNQRAISILNDEAKPYDSSSADVQKQYVGVAGPNPGVPPVRVGEGNPEIPATATSTTTTPNWAVAIVCIPAAESIGSWKTTGLYACSTSDVSEMLGFSGEAVVAQTRQGISYNIANAPTYAAPLPTATVGAIYGWYVASSSEPIYANGPLFVRCPTLTHQSHNWGKGIPSKIIASLPADSFSRNVSSGYSYFSPSEMTYLDLHNPGPLHFNDIRLEIVDKMEEVVEVLDKSTTITLHFRQKRN
jgi:hypothetical protein